MEKVQKVEEHHRQQSTSNLVHTFAGGISGGIASIMLQPLDVIKTRQQQLAFSGTNSVSRFFYFSFFKNLPKKTFK